MNEQIESMLQGLHEQNLNLLLIFIAVGFGALLVYWAYCLTEEKTRWIEY